MMRTVTKIILAVSFMALAGCSSLNPFNRKNTVNEPAVLSEIKPSVSIKSVWSSAIGAGGGYHLSPALVGDALFVAATDGSLLRLQAATGAAVWRINVGMVVTAGVGSDGASVVVAGEKGVVQAYDADGKLRWKAQASSEVLSAPAVGQGLVIIRSLDNRVTAYDAQTGVRRWVVQRNAPSLTLRASPGIVIDGATIYAGMPGGKLLALALNGAVRWEAIVSESRGATELERLTDISGAPVIFGSDVCVNAYQGKLACYDTVTGKLNWSTKFSSDASPAIDAQFVFAVDERSNVFAFARALGGILSWKNTQLTFRHLSAPVVLDRRLVVADLDGVVHVLSREDGAILGRLNTDGSAISVAPIISGSRLIFQTQAGTITAVTIE